MGARAPERILLIRLSAVGDVINTLPALESIRRGFPKAFVGFVVEDRAHDLIARHPCVDRVHLYRRKRWARFLHQPARWWTLFEEFSAFARGIRREGYEAALDLQSNLKGALHGLLSGARRRLGFSRGHCREASYLLNNEHVTPESAKINRVQKFLSMAAAIGAPVNGAAYRLPETAEGRRRTGDWIAAQGLSGYVALHPGTSDFGKLKRWIPERFAALAARIGDELRLPSVVTWGPGEKPLAEEIAAGSRGHARVAPETGSILDLAELIRAARVFVGCDSGPLHLSSAVSTPSVALFGPKDPRTYGPWFPVHRVVVKGEPGQGSMDAISVDDAFAAVRDLLAELATSSRG
jgi:3-deoxy-D-manno-octulosonic-acid transferase/heptosyltransferase-1